MINKIILLSFSMALITLYSCSESGPNISEPEEVVAVANAPSSATVGVEVTLDGSGSTGPIVAYGWLMVSQPQNSASSINNSESVIANFTPDVAGDYVIRLNAISNESLPDSDEVTITASNGS
jgi:hypothetical protein